MSLGPIAVVHYNRVVVIEKKKFKVVIIIYCVNVQVYKRILNITRDFVSPIMLKFLARTEEASLKTNIKVI